MRQDHRPYWLRQIMDAYESWHSQHFLAPAFDTMGPGCSVTKPWNVHVFGGNIHMGRHVEVRAAQDGPIRFTTWRRPDGDGQLAQGRIRIGDCCLIGPGVRIQAARSVELHDAVMLASRVLVSDADWHGLYDRVESPGRSLPVVIGENAWIGDSALVLKGSRIGRNSIIGAGSVVAGVVPDNVIAAGNPARVLRRLDPERPCVSRLALYADPAALQGLTDGLYRYALKGNSLAAWLRTRVLPRRGD
ncbi:MAG: acyltransferase [Alphaproteobacteria bacterium]